MQSYLFIGGAHDGLDFPVADDAEFVQWPVDDADSETYVRESLSVGDASVVIFRHQSLSSSQVLDRLVKYYKAWSWAVNPPVGRQQSDT